MMVGAIHTTMSSSAEAPGSGAADLRGASAALPRIIDLIEPTLATLAIRTV